MEERAQKMYDKAIEEAMKWLSVRDASIIRMEADNANTMANYWFGYAAGISQLMESINEENLV